MRLPARLVLTIASALAFARTGMAQQTTTPAPVSRTDVTRQQLPPGDYRNVVAAVVELAPGASAGIHRHDVAILAFVLEGAVENRLNGGTPQTTHAGGSWWEAPGTIHDHARNPSSTLRARFLVVYIGEEGKALTAPVDTARPPRQP